MLPDVRIIKGRGGLGRQKPTDDGISGLLTQGLAVAGKLALDTNYELRSVQQAEALGIVATGVYATTHYHISEYFRLNPGAILLVRVVAQTVPMVDMLDRTLTHAKSMLVAGNGRIKQLGVVLNPAAGYVPAVSHGFDDDVFAAVAKAQALAEEEFVQHRPVVILLAGHSYAGDAGDIINLRAQDAELVSVVLGTDFLKYPKEPALGTLLGTVSAAAVHENVGWVGKFNLASDGYFLQAGLSNGKALSALVPGDVESLHDKGYILALQHAGIDGNYWNDSHTCTGLDNDYAYIENNRTIHKACTITRRALLPSLKGPLPLTATGALRPAVVASLEASIKTAIEAGMLRAGEISDLDVYIDPDQNVQSTSKVEVKLNLISVATGRLLEATVGFAQTL